MSVLFHSTDFQSAYQEGGGTVSLGNNANIVSPPGGEGTPDSLISGAPPSIGGRVLRFFLQAAARELLPHERVARCLRVPVALVGVNWGLEHQRAFYSGLETCSSVWACPVCGTKIAERRRVDIGAAIEAHTCSGGVTVMFTFTVRHHRGDQLADTVDGMLRAHRRLKQGKAFQAFKERIGFVGTIRALEVTHGEVNGWHPHLHELWFLPAGADLAEVESFLRSRWSSMLRASGLREVNQHGLQMDYQPDRQQALKVYVSKLGQWDLAAEMTRAATKRARGVSGRTPAALLHDYTGGDDDAGTLWREYATTFKGRNHLSWSAGLRDRLLPGSVELTDEQIAAKEEERALVLAALNLSQWRAILGNDIRAEVLQVADSGNPLALWEYLSQFNIYPDER